MSRDNPAAAEEVGQRVAQRMRDVYRRAAALAARLTEQSGLHPTDVRALRVLDAAAEGPLTVGELGARLGLSSAAVTGLVDRLEAAGLARRRPDPDDRRRVLVSLGEAARAFGQAQLAPIQAAIARAIAAADAEELAAVDRFLAVLLAGDEPGREVG